jgi:hypothetical protein
MTTCQNGVATGMNSKMAGLPQVARLHPKCTFLGASCVCCFRGLLRHPKDTSKVRNISVSLNPIVYILVFYVCVVFFACHIACVVWFVGCGPWAIAMNGRRGSSANNVLMLAKPSLDLL